MAGLWTKLNLKDERELVVLASPESFEAELAPLEGVSILRNLEEVHEVRFSLAFVTQQVELNRIASAVADKAEGDALLWFAYPKGSSKRYTCEFNRDTGWTVLGEAGWEPVRQVAIDEDWSALRFRRVEYIKSFKRESKHAISKQGKRRSGGNQAPEA
jgi:hypothetical protein